jgi:hypothetical protein
MSDGVRDERCPNPDCSHPMKRHSVDMGCEAGWTRYTNGNSRPSLDVSARCPSRCSSIRCGRGNWHERLPRSRRSAPTTEPRDREYAETWPPAWFDADLRAESDALWGAK